jgi:hypothetical protein
VKRRGEHEALLRDNETGELKRAMLKSPTESAGQGSKQRA